MNLTQQYLFLHRSWTCELGAIYSLIKQIWDLQPARETVL